MCREASSFRDPTLPIGMLQPVECMCWSGLVRRMDVTLLSVCGRKVGYRGNCEEGKEEVRFQLVAQQSRVQLSWIFHTTYRVLPGIGVVEYLCLVPIARQCQR